MPSSVEHHRQAPAADRTASTRWQIWNRRLHYFLGLYFLFFIWLFALTGLLLNHGEWNFAEFWSTRRITTFEQPIQRPPAGNAEVEAKDVLRQLALTGEIQWLAAGADPARPVFRATRPGQQFDITADFAAGRAKIQRTEVNGWGILRHLHTFTGVRIGDTKNRRDWVLTTLWAYSMDAVSLGIAVMVLSGIALWWVRKGRRIAGLVALAGGVMACGWFLVGLRWFQS